MNTSPQWKITRISNEDVFLEGCFPFTTWFLSSDYPKHEIGASYDGSPGCDWASETVCGMLDNRLTTQFEQLKNLDKFLPWNIEIYHTQVFHL